MISFKAKIVSLLTFLMVGASVWADRPAPERQYIEVAPGSQYFFIMLPAGAAGNVVLPPRGHAYKLERGGSFVSLWQVEGWFAQSTLLTRDGHHLVRMGPWASAPPEDELAVAFYKDGEEHARYSVADLLEDTDKIERSVSHYRWESYSDEFPRLTVDNRFQLLTIENTLITFDVATGELIDRKHHKN